MARTGTISPSPASRGWRGRCGKRSPSIRRPPAKSLRPKARSATDCCAEKKVLNPNPVRSQHVLLEGPEFMSVYTVHAPAASDLREQTDKFVFVRDGFHFWAMLLGPFWLAWHRLWLVLLGYFGVTIVTGVALVLLGAGTDARALVFLLLALLMGLEAASLRRWSYSRGRWRQIDFVVADDEEAAERRFFDRWTESHDTGPAPSFHVPPAPNQPRGIVPPSQGIIGLFPEPGGSR